MSELTQEQLTAMRGRDSARQGRWACQSDVDLHDLLAHVDRLVLRLEACKETGQRVDDQLIEAQRRLHSARKIITDALGGVEGEIDYGEARAWLDSAPAVETREQSEDERLREVVGTFAAVVERKCPYCGAPDNGTCAYPSERKPGCVHTPLDDAIATQLSRIARDMTGSE